MTLNPRPSVPLTPYDRGERLEPKLWIYPWEIPNSPGADAYGKVDFDDDEGVTWATVWFEKTSAGGYLLHVNDRTPIELLREED